MEATAFEQVTRQMVANLEERLDKHESRQNGCLDRIDARLEGIEKELRGRPSWVTVLVITTLSSLVVGLGTYIVTL